MSNSIVFGIIEFLQLHLLSVLKVVHFIYHPGWLPKNVQAEFFVFKHLLIPKFILMIVFLSTSVILASFALIFGLDLYLIILYLIFIIFLSIILFIRDVVMNYLKTGMFKLQDDE